MVRIFLLIKERHLQHLEPFVAGIDEAGAGLNMAEVLCCWVQGSLQAFALQAPVVIPLISYLISPEFEG